MVSLASHFLNQRTQVYSRVISFHCRTPPFSGDSSFPTIYLLRRCSKASRRSFPPISANEVLRLSYHGRLFDVYPAGPCIGVIVSDLVCLFAGALSTFQPRDNCLGLHFEVLLHFF